MIIGIDGNEANIANRVGVGQFAFNLLGKLYEIDRENHYLIYLKTDPLSDMPQPRPNWTYRVFGPEKLWTKIALPYRLFTQKEKLNLFFSPGHYTPLFCPCPVIPTIHDLGYLFFQDQFTKKDLYQLINWTRESIRKAAHIVTVSEFSKSEIVRIYGIHPDKITVVFNGVKSPPALSAKFSSDTLVKFQITNPYFLYLGTLKPNKNIPFLIKSFAKFIKSNPDYQLVIAGKKGWLFDRIFQTVADEKLEDKVIFTDFIDDTQKWALYKKAFCFVIPSTYEGFGIPAIEAMSLGTPVIASSIPPFREVIKDSGLFIDPQNSDDLVQKMTSLTDPKLHKRLSQQGPLQAAKFTWDNSAMTLIKVFNSFKNS